MVVLPHTKELIDESLADLGDPFKVEFDNPESIQVSGHEFRCRTRNETALVEQRYPDDTAIETERLWVRKGVEHLHRVDRGGTVDLAANQ